MPVQEFEADRREFESARIKPLILSPGAPRFSAGIQSGVGMEKGSAGPGGVERARSGRELTDSAGMGKVLSGTT